MDGKLIDLTGQKFGDLTVIDYAGNSKWNCQCSCGNTTTVAAYSLKSGTTKSCGHRRKEESKPKIDLTGQKFGDLTVIDYAGHGKWNCRCSCGKTTTVVTTSLKNGMTKSCGHRRNAKAKGRPMIDLTGQKFGDLTVIDYAGHGKWNCQCSCGKTTTVITHNLKSGSTKSCGHRCNKRIDLTGQKFGDLTAINYARNGKKNK